MSLFHALELALAVQGAVLQDCDGSALSGPQLLRLVAATSKLVQQAAREALPSAPSALCVCAIFLTNSAAYVVAVLAALRLGLAFMPLDPDWPPQRLQQLCDEAQPSAVLWAAANCPGGHGRPSVGDWPMVQLPGLGQLLQPVAESAEGGQAAAEQQQQQRFAVNPAGCDACYLLYTSGSTGRPLGVLGTQAGVLNRCRWMEQVHPFQAGDRVAFKTAPAFVDSIWEVFGPLLAGALLVAVPRSVGRDPGQLLRTLADHSITHFAAVPTLWRSLVAAMRQDGSAASHLRLRFAVSSGEPLSPGLLNHIQLLLPPSCRIFNLYGSTEVAADCTAFDCTAWQPQQGDKAQQPQGHVQPSAELPDQQQRVPVGQPVHGMLVAVLEAELPADAAPSSGQPPAQQETAEAAGAAGSERAVLALGSVGEVAVAGTGLAAGYLCRHPAAEGAQRRRFVQLPTQQLAQALAAGGSVAAAADLSPAFWQQGSVRAFLTGDLGWLDAAACLHLLGRRDHQVKLSGVRIDLTEVEAALGQHPAVAAAAAKLWHLPAGPVIAAYVQLVEQQPSGSNAVGRNGGAPAVHSCKLQQWCQERLPAAAVPQHVLLLPQLPRSAAGKVQRSQLPHPFEAAAGAAAEKVADAAAPVQGGLHRASAGSSSPPSKRPRSRTAKAAAAPLRQAGAQPISELAVSRAFAAALGHSNFEATTNLFSIGGNSLMAAQIAGQVAGGDVEAVFSHPTVRSLAAFLGGDPAAAGSGGDGSREQQPGAPEAPLLHARRLHLGSSVHSAEQQGEQPSRPQLQLAWRAKMLQCVDAAPVFEATAGSGQQEVSRHVFACSHGGDVCCFEAGSGTQLWSTQLSDRTDAGLVLCSGAPLASSSMQSGRDSASDGAQQTQQAQQQFLAVATNSGTLAFLRTVDGCLVGSIECGGGIRAPPVCDPWCGFVWQPTHGQQLVVAAAPGTAVAQLSLPAAASAAVTFDAGRRLALVCCLDGSLVAVAVDVEQLAAAAAAAATRDTAAANLGGGSGGRPLTVAWQQRTSAPLFVPAARLPSSSIAIAAVDGSVSCLSSRDGSRLWRASVQGAVFAPMLLLPPGSGQQAATLLVGSQTGQLAALDPATGGQLGALQLGAKIVGMQLLPVQAATVGAADAAGAMLGAAAATAAAEAGGATQHGNPLLVITLALGVVAVVAADILLSSSGAVDSSSCVLDTVQLPADVFAMPSLGSRQAGSAAVAVGCRDDHLYCLCMSYLHCQNSL